MVSRECYVSGVCRGESVRRRAVKTVERDVRLRDGNVSAGLTSDFSMGFASYFTMGFTSCFSMGFTIHYVPNKGSTSYF